MFDSEELKKHLETSSTIKAEPFILAEWNMNSSDNILKIGNYRYRKNDTTIPKYQTLVNTFDEYDEAYFYTGATDADVVIDGGFDDQGIPTLFRSGKLKEELLYSLEDCLKKFRPRSGINKIRFLDNGEQFVNFAHPEMARRPRFYPASKQDLFKYWTSYRTESIYEYSYPSFTEFGANPKYSDVNNNIVDGKPVSSIERGVANRPNQSRREFFIDDAVPFVVYKNPINVNRIVVKMQTGIGDVNLGPFSDESGSFEDPFFGRQNASVPVKWKIEYLQDNSWLTAISFDQNSISESGGPIIGPDGYVELEYGLIVPDQYKDIFKLLGEFSSASYLPINANDGDAYLIKPSKDSLGEIRMWLRDFDSYISIAPKYGWQLARNVVDSSGKFVTKLVNPDSYISPTSRKRVFREFQEIVGVRVVVETMSKSDATFDLIEISPRLAVDLTDRVLSYSLQKTASDLGISGLPVSQLLASVGSIDIFNFDEAFNPNNSQSIISSYNSKNIQFRLYEKIKNVEDVVVNNKKIASYDYYVPVKTLYADELPSIQYASHTVSIGLRDLFFYFESITAPELLITNASLSYVISLLMDYIGFSNYTFKRAASEPDPIIPYFFVEPDISVAEVLNMIAVSTQSAMFFDEYNNFVVATKEYMLPDESVRAVDISLIGSKDFASSGAVKNQSTSESLANIMDVSFQNNDVFNDGKISYTARSIQRTYPTVKQFEQLDRDKTWTYSPVLLWEVSGENNPKSINNEVERASEYSLTAIPLNADLTADPPAVVNFRLVNNVVDFGEAVMLPSRYNGYFYANGEVIRFDAVEYSIPGLSILDSSVQSDNVWISSLEEYQNYFSKIPFRGKMYPTGLVRIYSEPIYEVVDGITRLKNGPVAKHGRGQFGTTVTSHSSGLSSHWTNSSNIHGIEMQSDFLFTDASVLYPPIAVGAAGVGVNNSSNTIAAQSSRNGIIKNFMAPSFKTEMDVNKLVSTQSGTVQSSALVFNGPSEAVSYTPINFVSYVKKPLDSKFKHFGTRLRIVGRLSGSESRTQTADGSMTYYGFNGTTPSEENLITGGSGGLGVLINPETNNGYYFEAVALSNDQRDSGLHNLLFYKIVTDSISGTVSATSNTTTITGISNTTSLKVNQTISKISGAGNFGQNARITAVSENSVTITATTTNTAGQITFTTRSAIPIKLWGGSSSILVDDGKLVGQYRMSGEKNPTVYDLAVEYVDVGPVRRFFLYLDNQLVSVVEDINPLPLYNNMALFVRGTARLMFEHVYALGENYSQNTSFELGTPVSSIFGTGPITANKAFNRYAISGMVSSLYLSGVSASEPPKYNVFYDEFGTIMREAVYFNVKYDRAYPTLYAKISPTFNKIKGYSVSGFEAGAYGAEFLVFNNTDTVISLDASSGNYLRIQGVAFTSSSDNDLTMDDYFADRSDFSKPRFVEGTRVLSPIEYKSKYQDIKISRSTYGRKEFSLDAPYIQTQDDANNLMGWLVSKVTKPRKSVGLQIFPIPTLQLGDIVNIKYKDLSGMDVIADEESRFVVYNIEYERDGKGPSMKVYLSEVV